MSEPRSGERPDTMSEPGALPPGMASGTAGDGFDAESGSHGGPGLLRGLLAALLGSIKTRLDLAAVEAEIYLLYVAQLLLWGFAAVACALLAIVFALTAVVITLWDTHRLLGLLGSMAVLIVLAVVCGLVGARIFRARPPLFSGTLGQFEHDHRRMAGGRGEA